MTYKSFILLIATASLLLFLATGTPTKRVAIGSDDCDPYAYCNGHKFPSQVTLNAHIITCDNMPTPRDRCCLPQANHFVCYAIRANNVKLNYDENNNAKSTDFTGLCNAMARSYGNRTGKHSSAVIKNEGGTFVWRYGEWAPVELGTKHVETLACEILP